MNLARYRKTIYLVVTLAMALLPLAANAQSERLYLVHIEQADPSQLAAYESMSREFLDLLAKQGITSTPFDGFDVLMLDDLSRSDTYPYIDVKESDVDLGHEATVSKIGEEQLFYLMSRGLNEAEASAMIVSGFVEPITKELPLEYAVEMNRLIQLQMEGSVG